MKINIGRVEQLKTAAKLAERLAAEFSTILHEWLNKDQVEDINRKNASPEYKDGCCATHDYCDPNEAMIQAFEKVIGRKINMQQQSDINLINIAWNVARAQEFVIY